MSAFGQLRSLCRAASWLVLNSLASTATARPSPISQHVGRLPSGFLAYEASRLSVAKQKWSSSHLGANTRTGWLARLQIDRSTAPGDVACSFDIASITPGADFLDMSSRR